MSDFITSMSRNPFWHKLLLQQFMGEKFGRDNIWESHLASELWTTQMEIRAVLDEQQIPLRRVLDLKIGDTIFLNATPDSVSSHVNVTVTLLLLQPLPFGTGAATPAIVGGVLSIRSVTSVVAALPPSFRTIASAARRPAAMAAITVEGPLTTSPPANRRAAGSPSST